MTYSAYKQKTNKQIKKQHAKSKVIQSLVMKFIQWGGDHISTDGGPSSLVVGIKRTSVKPRENVWAAICLWPSEHANVPGL